MKLLVVSHACCTPENQLFFQKIADVSGWDVSIISPEIWDTDYKRGLKTVKHNSFQGNLTTIKTFFRGNVPLHFYHMKIFSVIMAEMPDAIYVHNESYCLSTFQITVFNHIMLRRPIALYAAQNILKTYPLPFRVLEKFVFRVAKVVFPVTYSAKVCLEERGYTGKSIVLPLGLNESFIMPTASEVVNTQFNTPSIGFVGRLVPEKGIRDLILALSMIADKEWICHIVGDGPQRVELIQLAADLGLYSRVKFDGFIDHGKIKELIKEFTILVLPSKTQRNWKEQFGRVIIEALALGIPVIGSDCGEIPFLIEKLGGGLIVEEGNIEGLAFCLSDLISNPDRRALFGERGRSNVICHFTESKIAADFTKAFLQSAG